MALKTVVVEFFADTKHMVSSLGKTEKKVNTVTRSMRRLGVTLAGVFGARALFRTFNRTLLDADTLVQTARGAGVAADEYERLGFAFEAARVPVDQLRQGLGDLQLRLGDVSRNYDKYYRKIGLDPNQLRKQSPAQQLVQTVSALGKIENQARRVGLAGRVLGEESSRQLIKLVSDGGKAFQESLKQFDRYGSALQDPRNVQSIREFSFETLKLQRQWEVLKQRVVIGTLPAFQKLVRDLDESGALEKLADDMVTIAGAVADMVKSFAKLRAEGIEGVMPKSGFLGSVGDRETDREIQNKAKLYAGQHQALLRELVTVPGNEDNRSYSITQIFNGVNDSQLPRKVRQEVESVMDTRALQ